MKKFALVLFCGIGLPIVAIQQEPILIHSTRPEYENYSEIIEIVETHTYGVYEPVDSPEAWSSCFKISPGPDSGVLVTDIRDSKVHLVVPGRGVVATYGQGEGAGPGELAQPVSATYDNRGRVYITEYGGVRISIFRKNGDFLRILRLERRPYQLVMGKRDEIWSTRTPLRYQNEASRYNLRTGDHIQQLGGKYSDQEWARHLRLAPYIARSQDAVIVSTAYPYEIVEYSLEGQIRRIITRRARWLTPPEYLFEPEAEGDLWMSEGGMIRQVSVFPDQTIAVHFQRYQWKDYSIEKWTSFIDLFDSDGNWITTIPNTAFGKDMYLHDIAVAGDGAIWLCYFGDYPTITRYEMTFKQ